MELLERYIQAVGSYLPEANRADVLAELRANLLDEIEAREDELNRPLQADEVAALLQAHGRPVMVAAGYGPQRFLIGPALFPIYESVLRKVAPIVVLISLLVRAVTILALPLHETLSKAIIGGVLQLVPTLLTFWAVVTIVFGVVEQTQHVNEFSDIWMKWDPLKLPSLSAGAGLKTKSLVGRIIDLVFQACWTAYVIAVPSHPYLMFGQGLRYLEQAGMRPGSMWHAFYAVLVVVLLVELMARAVALVAANARVDIAIKLAEQAAAVALAFWLATQTTYLVPIGSVVANLGIINDDINHALRVVVAVNVFVLGLNAWRALRGKAPAARFAF
jgi:hypothetical protein